MIAKTVDGAALESPAVHYRTIRPLLDLDPQGLQSGRHGRDAIAFLDAQFLETREDGLARRGRGRHEQHRKFIDRERYEARVNGAAAQS